MTAFISFNAFAEVVKRAHGIQLFVLTADCGDAARDFGARLQQEVLTSAGVHLICADVDASPTLVYYEGGDMRPLLTREGAAAFGTARADVAEAARIAGARPSADEESRQRAEAEEATERMLASERLDQFPPFFRMARNLARDAWHAARKTAEGAPLLLPSEAAHARLGICSTCPSLHGDRCVECGCYMTVKAHLAAMRCPLGKWEAEERPRS